MSFAEVKASTSSLPTFEVFSGACHRASGKERLMLTPFDRYVFNDFGKDFACVDPTGENPQSGMIVHVEDVSDRIVFA